jgi:hypothetical protein
MTFPFEYTGFHNKKGHNKKGTTLSFSQVLSLLFNDYEFKFSQNHYKFTWLLTLKFMQTDSDFQVN